LTNGQPQAFYSDLYKGPLKGYFIKDPDSRDTLFGRVMYHRLLRALEVVTSQPEWNGQQLIVHGRSQGGGQAIAAAGLDPRVTLMCAQIPVFCDNTGMILGRSSGSHGIVAIDEKGVPNPKALEAVRYYDGTNWATRTKAEGFFTVGFIDTSCPPTGIYAVYNLWAGKKDILSFPRWGHIAAPEGDEAVRKKVLAHIGRTPEEISAAVAKKDTKQQAGEE
jgi:cephalosporin-C deacetylase-like acetyl esterase